MLHNYFQQNMNQRHQPQNQMQYQPQHVVMPNQWNSQTQQMMATSNIQQPLMPTTMIPNNSMICVPNTNQFYEYQYQMAHRKPMAFVQPSNVTYAPSTVNITLVPTVNYMYNSSTNGNIINMAQTQTCALDTENEDSPLPTHYDLLPSSIELDEVMKDNECEVFSRLEVFSNKISQDSNAQQCIVNWLGSCKTKKQGSHQPKVVRHSQKQRRLYFVSCLNALVEMHYNFGSKPNTLHLAFELLHYLLAKGKFDFSTMDTNPVNSEIMDGSKNTKTKCNLDCVLALFIACKVDEGHGMPNNMFFKFYEENIAAKYASVGTSKHQSSCTCAKCQPKIKDFTEWLKQKEVEFVLQKLRGNTIQSTRFEYLLYYLKKIGFKINSSVAEEYRSVKNKWSQIRNLSQDENVCTDDMKNKQMEILEYETASNICFSYLCRYLCEMSYYHTDFLCADKQKIAIAVIYSAYIIAFKFSKKYNFKNILLPKNLVCVLNEADIMADTQLYEMIRSLIQISRAPNVCIQTCNGKHENGIKCECKIHSELNSFLKYSKPAFGGVARFDILSTEKNIKRFHLHLQTLEAKEHLLQRSCHRMSFDVDMS